jgi:enoyl reductase
MSKAVIFVEYGDPEVLQVVDIPPPQPGPGQVRVRVRTSGIEPFDFLIRSGLVREQISAVFPQKMGGDFAGVVDAVGDAGTAIGIGDEVVGWTFLAAHAEHVVVPTDQVLPKPASIPWTAAGALSTSGQTAATVLTKLDVGKDDTVLIHGAAGGVGSFAVQIAKARGAATVIGTASERNHDYLRSLGAIPVSYGQGLADRVRAAAPRGVDTALDAAGSPEALPASLSLVADKQRIGTIAWQAQAAADELGVRRLFTEPNAAQLGELLDLCSAGTLRVEVQQTYPLEEAAEAHRVIQAGHVRGKLVFTI